MNRPTVRPSIRTRQVHYAVPSSHSDNPFWFPVVTYLCFSARTTEHARKVVVPSRYQSARHGGHLDWSEIDALCKHNRVALYHGHNILPVRNLRAYLRKCMARVGHTQTSLAAAMCVARATVNRWMSESEPLMPARELARALYVLTPDEPLIVVATDDTGKWVETSTAWAQANGLPVTSAAHEPAPPRTRAETLSDEIAIAVGVRYLELCWVWDKDTRNRFDQGRGWWGDVTLEQQCEIFDLGIYKPRGGGLGRQVTGRVREGTERRVRGAYAMTYNVPAVYPQTPIGRLAYKLMDAQGLAGRFVKFAFDFHLTKEQQQQCKAIFAQRQQARVKISACWADNSALTGEPDVPAVDTVSTEHDYDDGADFGDFETPEREATQPRPQGMDDDPEPVPAAGVDFDEMSKPVETPADVMESEMAKMEHDEDVTNEYAVTHVTNTFVWWWNRVRMDARRRDPALYARIADQYVVPSHVGVPALAVVSKGLAQTVELLLGDQPVDLSIGAVNAFMETFIAEAVDTTAFDPVALGLTMQEWATMVGTHKDSALALDLSELPFHKLVWLWVALGLRPQVRVTVPAPQGHAGYPVMQRIPQIAEDAPTAATFRWVA